MESLMREISSARSALMLTHPFIGSLLMRCQIELTEAVPTAAVDGGNTIYINPQWASSISKKDLLTVLAHEALHLALRHGDRSKAVEDKMIYNFVADGGSKSHSKMRWIHPIGRGGYNGLHQGGAQMAL